MNHSLFRTAEAAFAREFCHGTHGGLFGAQVRAIVPPVDPDPLRSATGVPGSTSNPSAVHTAPSPAVAPNPAVRGFYSNGDAK
jgi:hypothetical protein